MDGLTSGHDSGSFARFHAQDDDRPAATENETDLRRAREHASAVIDDLESDIQEFLERENVQLVTQNERAEQRINETITRLAAVKLQNDLRQWLEQRRRQTWGRAVRAALDQVQTTLQEATRRTVRPRDLSGRADFGPQDQHLNRVINRIDAGLLFDEDDSLANETGNRITRQLKVGVDRGEPLRSTDPDALDLSDRVSMVLTDSDSPDKRRRAGVTGQLVKTKAELIAHDSIQQGYNFATTERYLRNGFQFVTYDAVCDFKTTELCQRLGECNGPPVVIDLTKTPWLVPPNHPWCRSGIRPTLNREGRKPVTEDRIADGFLQTIFKTKSFRPMNIDVDSTLQRTALQRAAEGTPGGA